MWAGGIEDTFIPQVATSTGRVLDEYDLTQHDRFWRDDLQRAADLGIRWMRYGVPWYKVNPATGVFDWSWTDQVIPYMVQDLGIQPIVDLVHYGCPLWLEREFINPTYAEHVAAYARAFVERYRSLTRYYTPLNEPLITTRYCGYTAQWPPYLRGWRGYVRVLTAIAHGISRTIAEIRAAQPDAVIVQVEAASSNVTDDPSLQDDLAFLQRRQFLPNDLVLGRVNEAHPLRPWLLQHGAAPGLLDWLATHPQAIDIVGVNFYPGLSCFRLLRQNDTVRRKRYYGGVAELEWVLRAYHAHYQQPVMITEISTIGTVARRLRWLHQSLAVVRHVRADGIPIIGYTWWPLFSLVSWNYRRGRKLVGAYLAHMGLWDLHEDSSGTFIREPTPLVGAYAACIANPSEWIGEIGPLEQQRGRDRE
jgi:beta-glucosidase/6-phospho-beta-glucosidase/beta-galactosidase